MSEHVRMRRAGRREGVGLIAAVMVLACASLVGLAAATEVNLDAPYFRFASVDAQALAEITYPGETDPTTLVKLTDPSSSAPHPEPMGSSLEKMSLPGKQYTDAEARILWAKHLAKFPDTKQYTEDIGEARFAIFKQNLEKVSTQNFLHGGGFSYKAAFADLTATEFSQMKGAVFKQKAQIVDQGVILKQEAKEIRAVAYKNWWEFRAMFGEAKKNPYKTPFNETAAGKAAVAKRVQVKAAKAAQAARKAAAKRTEAKRLADLRVKQAKMRAEKEKKAKALKASIAAKKAATKAAAAAKKAAAAAKVAAAAAKKNSTSVASNLASAGKALFELNAAAEDQVLESEQAEQEHLLEAQLEAEASDLLGEHSEIDLGADEELGAVQDETLLNADVDVVALETEADAEMEMDADLDAELDAESESEADSSSHHHESIFSMENEDPLVVTADPAELSPPVPENLPQVVSAAPPAAPAAPAAAFPFPGEIAAPVPTPYDPATDATVATVAHHAPATDAPVAPAADDTVVPPVPSDAAPTAVVVPSSAASKSNNSNSVGPTGPPTEVTTSPRAAPTPVPANASNIRYPSIDVSFKPPKNRKVNKKVVDIDWRTKGVSSPVKSQGQCGSCYAQSAVVILESGIAIQMNRTTVTPLSVQQIVSCDTADSGCDGGNPITALDYAANWALAPEAKYPYSEEAFALGGPAPICNETLRNNGFPFVKTYNTYDTEEEIAIALQRGPLTALVDASKWQFYDGSKIVYPASGCKSTVDALDHSVVIVGLSSLSNGERYWIVRNHWDTHWGAAGYIFLSYGTNTCGTCASLQHSFTAAGLSLERPHLTFCFAPVFLQVSRSRRPRWSSTRITSRPRRSNERGSPRATTGGRSANAERSTEWGM
jgi:C1A family cysteine protease